MLKQLSFLTFLCILQLGLIPCAFAASRNYFEMPFMFGDRTSVSDLDSTFTKAELEILSNHWTITTPRQVSLDEARINKCENNQNIKFFGGIGIFGNSEKMTTSYNLNTHAWIAYSITVRAFNMDSNDRFTLKIGNQEITVPIPATSPADTCTNGVRQYMVVINGNQAHSDSTLQVTVQSSSTKSVQQAGLGISDIQILAHQDLSHYQTTSYWICPEGLCPRDGTGATCPLSQYPQSGACEPCHASCASCHQPKTGDPKTWYCNACKSGYTFLSTGECGSNRNGFYRQGTPNNISSGICLFNMVQVSTTNCATSCVSSLPISIGLDIPRACAAKCPEGEYMAWNFTCITSCPFYQRRTTTNLGDFCDYPCLSKEEYLYANGSCLKSCPYGKKVVQPGDYNFCEGGVLVEEVTIDSKQATLFMSDVWTYPQKDTFTIGQKTYNLDATWAILGLKPESRTYKIQNWDSSFSCGCGPHRCGAECKQGVLCNDTNPFKFDVSCLLPGAPKKNFCWNVYSEGEQIFQAYRLELISLLSLLDFGGDGVAFASPGFTVSIRPQNYSYSAAITEYTTDYHLDQLLYATSENRIISKEELEAFEQEKPRIEVDLDNATCDEDSGYLPRIIRVPKISGDSLSLSAYVILNKAPIESFYTLNKLKILTPSDGVQEWSSLRPFKFLDPCNQQYLTLTVSHGAFFVNTPGHQKLLPGDVICIAVSLDYEDSRNLVLYETQVGGTKWVASERFRGLLSQDFVNKLHLRVTTKSSIPLNAEADDDDKVTIEINDKSEPPRLFAKTSLPMMCTVQISKNCSFSFKTTATDLSYFREITNCGDLLAPITYQCNGFFGQSYPPSSLAAVPVQGFSLKKAEFKEIGREADYVNENSDAAFYQGTAVLILLGFVGLMIYGCWRVSKRLSDRGEDDIPVISLEGVKEMEDLRTEEDKLRVNTEQVNEDDYDDDTEE